MPRTYQGIHRGRVVVWGVLGAICGLAAYLPLSDWPDNPVQILIVSRTQPGSPHNLHIDLFGRQIVNRSSANRTDFDAEITFWSLLFPVTFAVCGLLGGGCAAYGFDRLFPPRRAERDRSRENHR